MLQHNELKLMYCFLLFNSSFVLYSLQRLLSADKAHMNHNKSLLKTLPSAHLTHLTCLMTPLCILDKMNVLFCLIRPMSPLIFQCVLWSEKSSTVCFYVIKMLPLATKNLLSNQCLNKIPLVKNTFLSLRRTFS